MPWRNSRRRGQNFRRQEKADFAGHLEINKLFLSPTAVPDTLKNCSLEVSFDNKAVELSKFSGEFGGGPLTLPVDTPSLKTLPGLI